MVIEIKCSLKNSKRVSFVRLTDFSIICRPLLDVVDVGMKTNSVETRRDSVEQDVENVEFVKHTTCLQMSTLFISIFCKLFTSVNNFHAYSIIQMYKMCNMTLCLTLFVRF